MIASFLVRISASLLTRLERVSTGIRSWYWSVRVRSGGGTVGRGLVVKKGAQFVFGKKCAARISSQVTLAEGAKIFLGDEGLLVLEERVFIGRDTSVVANHSVHIGAGSQIAHQVTVIDSDHRFEHVSRPLTEQGQVAGPVRIGAEVWVGCHSVILKGVNVGDHSVVGAGSVVTRDLPERSVAVGNPARVIRTRELS